MIDFGAWWDDLFLTRRVFAGWKVRAGLGDDEREGEERTRVSFERTRARSGRELRKGSSSLQAFLSSQSSVVSYSHIS